MRIKPKALKPGDTLAVVSPASGIDPEKMHQGLAVLHDAGFKTKLMPHVLDQEYYLAGNDEARASDLMSAFSDPEVSAVYCSRGGYGCARLFPYLDLDKMVNSRKMLIGFSDITTLHMAWQRRNGVSIHAPMALTLASQREPWVYDSFLRLLVGDPVIADVVPKAEVVVPGIATGTLVGGCMILICDAMGTPEQIDTKGKILVLEDVDENPHRVDAMMTHLLNAGVLQESAGVIVGEMTRTDERSDQTIGAKPWRDIVSERLIKAGVPSMLMFPFGHMKQMLSVPLGIDARMDAERGTLTYLENPCDV
jgi:muramoyltetrapeptide carboxypeptidase